MQGFELYGANGENRTRDLLITNVVCSINNQLNQCLAMAANTKNSLKKPRTLNQRPVFTSKQRHN